MSRTIDLAERVREIFAQELALELSELSPDLQYNAIPEWDSVAHMHLVAALEDELDIIFDDSEIVELTTLARLEDTVVRKLEHSQF